jgi:hypothetical protein
MSTGMKLLIIFFLYPIVGCIEKRGENFVWEIVCEKDGQEFNLRYISEEKLPISEEIKLCAMD